MEMAKIVIKKVAIRFLNINWFFDACDHGISEGISRIFIYFSIYRNFDRKNAYFFHRKKNGRKLVKFTLYNDNANNTLKLIHTISV